MTQMILIALILLALELLYFKIADKLNIIDKPNARSSHTRVVLRGGGIVFLLAVWVYQLFFGLAYPWFMVGLTAISLISFADDIHPVPNKFRLVVQFASMMCLFAQFNLFTAQMWWWIVPALIVCVGIINAYNFMDGINGITGGYSMAVLLPLVYLNESLHFVDSDLLSVVVLSDLVFCFFNYRRVARCFAGDVGSIGMAFILMFLLGSLIVQTGQLAYILFLAVYGVDTILTIIHRIMLHENLGLAHRKHAYQLMANELKMQHTMVSTFYMTLQLVVSAGLIALEGCEWPYFVAVCLVLGLAYIAFMRKYYHLHDEYLKRSQS